MSTTRFTRFSSLTLHTRSTLPTRLVRLRHVALLLVGACALQASAQPVLAERAQAMAQQQVVAGGFRSLVIGLVDGDRSAVFGFSAKGTPLPDGGSVYEIGSVTKTFTGLLLAQQVHAGKLKADDPVSRLLPGQRVPDLDGRSITLLDLVTQTSGLPRLPSNLDLTRLANPYARYDRAALGSFLDGHQLKQRPGERYDYSNLGFGLLGVALSTQAGESYGDLVKARILTPLGMTSTSVSVDDAMRRRLVPGHGQNGQPVSGWDFDAMAGAGALKSDADDLLRYLRAAMRGATERDSPMGLAQTPQRDTGIPGTRIGYAWHITDARGRLVVWHNGMTGGYASFIGFTADGQRGVVVLADAMRSVDALAMTALLPELAPPPSRPPAASTPAPAGSASTPAASRP